MKKEKFGWKIIILATFKKNISKYKKVINEIEMKLIVILHLVTSKYNL